MNELYQRLPGPHKVLIGIISLFTLLLIFLPSPDASASRSRDGADLAVGENYQLALELPGAEPSDDDPLPQPLFPFAEVAPELVADHDNPGLDWQDIKVLKGDNLSKVFARAGFTSQELQLVLNLGKAVKPLEQRLRPGDQIAFGRDSDGRLAALNYQLDPLRTLKLSRDGDAFTLEEEVREYQLERQVASATINSSFYNAGVDAGLKPQQIMDVANIFGWDIDFALDLRKGDRFSVVYEKRYIDGEYVSPGQILAAEFINQGEAFRAILHDDGSYYSPSGKALKKAFLRAPVEFKYVSSEFNPRRLHPVTGQVRPHRGIDYAAAVGTPVMAAGGGTVVESGYNGLNGNYVVIRHNSTYTTKYLHLNRRHVQKGQRVQQGQKIGTVGATGRVTGPHLHYEFIIDGVHRNPRSIKFPEAESLSGPTREAFVARATELTQLMALHADATQTAATLGEAAPGATAQ